MCTQTKYAKFPAISSLRITSLVQKYLSNSVIVGFMDLIKEMRTNEAARRNLKQAIC